MVLVVTMTLVACATLELNSFKALGVTQVTVDVAMKTYADLVVAGKISQATQDSVRKDYAIYQEVMRDAQGAVAIWKALSPDARPSFETVKGKVDAAVARGAVILAEAK
jgi:hypothetical protein